MFYVKRIYGPNHDWLHAWDDDWGTRCMFLQSKAMPFTTREDADSACERANATCKDMPEGMSFIVHEESIH